MISNYKEKLIGGCKVSILVPCHNEEKNLPLLYKELSKLVYDNPKYEWEILLIDDGSKDNTLQTMKCLREGDERVSYLALSRNFGKENAMLAGFDYNFGCGPARSPITNPSDVGFLGARLSGHLCQTCQPR